ncbi:hypothetical protein [Thermoleptolyngbya sp.]
MRSPSTPFPAENTAYRTAPHRLGEICSSTGSGEPLNTALKGGSSAGLGDWSHERPD